LKASGAAYRHKRDGGVICSPNGSKAGLETVNWKGDDAFSSLTAPSGELFFKIVRRGTFKPLDNERR